MATSKRRFHHDLILKCHLVDLVAVLDKGLGLLVHCGRFGHYQQHLHVISFLNF